MTRIMIIHRGRRTSLADFFESHALCRRVGMLLLTQALPASGEPPQ